MHLVRGVVGAAAFILAIMAWTPHALAAVDCTTGVPAEWEVIPEASSGGDLSFLCNYRVTKKHKDGSTTTSGTAVTVEFFCTPAAGREAYKGKTGSRETETSRTENRVVIQEGPAAPNPDNPHRDGVTTSFFPERTFDLFEKEWFLFGGDQAVATIVVITDKRDGHHSVTDVEGAPLRNLAFRNSPEQCAVPLGGSAASPGTGVGGKNAAGSVATGGGGIPPAVVVAAGGGGTVVIVTVIAKGRRRRRMLKPPKKYPGGNPWDPDDTERAKKWDKEGLVWDPTTLTWRPPRPDDFIEIDDVKVNPHQIPAQCRETYAQVQRHQTDLKNIEQYHEGQKARLQKGHKIYKENLARAVIIVGTDVVGATIAVAEGVANIPRAVIRTRSLVKNLNKADAGLELSQLRSKRKTLSSDVDGARKRVAELEGEAKAAAAEATKARAARTAAENHATEMERNARRAIVDETPPPELAAKRAQNDSARRRVQQELDDLAGLDQETSARAGAFRQNEFKAWQETSDYRNTRERITNAKLELDEFRAANADIAEIQGRVHRGLGDGSMSRADADEILASLPKDKLEAFNAEFSKLQGKVDFAYEHRDKLRQRHKEHFDGYEPEFERYVEPNPDLEQNVRHAKRRLQGLEGIKRDIDAEFEAFRQSTVVKNQKLLDDAAAARRKALDAGTDAEHPEHLERAANESLRNARADLARKAAALEDADTKMGELAKKLAKLDDLPPPIPPVRLVGWVLTPVGWVMEKVIGPTDSPVDIIKILGNNKIQLQRMEDTVKIGEKLIAQKTADAAATLEKLKQCIAVNSPQTGTGGR